MDQMIVGDPMRTVFHKPDKARQYKHASTRGNRKKQQEKAAAAMAEGWREDFEARVRARVAAAGRG